MKGGAGEYGSGVNLDAGRFFATAVLGTLLGIAIGAVAHRKVLRTEAVRLGHAEYRADKDGNVVWAWMEAGR